MARKKGKGAEKWISGLEEGGLHASLGVPEGEKIPQGKLKAARKGRYGAKAKKQANAAKTLAKLRKRK